MASSLLQAMELAGRNLVSSLLPTHGLRPFFIMRIDRSLRAEPGFSRIFKAHNIGRWWDALLRLEAATGFRIPGEAEEAMLRHLKACFDNPLDVFGSLEHAFEGHSQREAMLALAALVRYRNDPWAADQGVRTVRSLDRYLREDGAWDFERMETAAQAEGRTTLPVVKPWDDDPICTHGRLIEALVEFHQATGNEDAFRLAERLARFHFEHSTRVDGGLFQSEYDETASQWHLGQWAGPEGTKPATTYIHAHSLLGTYRGLLRFGIETRDQAYIDRIALTYAKTVRTGFKPSGFISHDWGKESTGEIATPGDVAQLALWLAQEGYREYLDDAERLLRSRILPSQIRKPLGLVPLNGNANPAIDLDGLALGAFGGMHQHPHGWPAVTTDITAACLHTLCEIHAHVVKPEGSGLRVNFHCDYDGKDIAIRARSGSVRRLVIRYRKPAALKIRIPAWAPRASVSVRAVNVRVVTRWEGTGVWIAAVNPAEPLFVEYDLPVVETAECIDGVSYKVRWHGDEIHGIAPNAEFLPFYPNLGVSTQSCATDATAKA